MVEYFVHIDRDDAPEDLVVVTADIADGVSRKFVSAKRLPNNWRLTPPPPDLVVIGDEFVRRSRAAVLIVPSALAPTECNWLLNPLHPDFSRIRLNPPELFQYDTRFYQ
jgi:RES domain-containing protein